ncbi:MAG: mucoidy inhibitor MuiA family protein [Bacteroidia bacterium]
MKNSFRLLVILIIINFSAKAQEPIWISNSEVKEVKIYQSGAMVSRTAKATLSPGLQEIVLDGLSPYINPQSIILKGTGDATILAVSFQQNYLTEQKKSKEIINLEDDLDSLNNRLQQIKNRNVVLTEAQNLLLANKSIGGATNGVVVDELELVLEYFLKKMNELKEEQLVSVGKEKKLNDQIKKLQQQLNVIRQKQQQSTGNIIVKVNVNSKTNSNFDFSYVISNNVSWYPFYDIKVKDVNSPAELVYKAKVSQSTGEDWNQVKIGLSTGNPSIGNDRPQMSPWYLNFYAQGYQLQGVRRDQKQLESAPMLSSGMAEDDVKEMTTIGVMMNENQLSTSFDIQGAYSIPSDGQEYQVEVQKFTLKSTYNYVGLPKLDGDAFLTASVTGWEELSLSPGGANVYFDGAFVGESFINPAETSDTLEISLGRDKRIVMKREKLKDISGNKFFGGNKERTLAFDINVKNGKKEAVTMVLYDQVPLSNQKDIEVKIEEMSGAQYNSETGEIKWTLTLAPGETVKKRLAFKVKYPKDKQIMGL